MNSQTNQDGVRQQDGINSKKLAELEAVLFWSAEPVAKERLAKLLEVSPTELQTLLNALAERQIGGLTIIDNGEDVTLATSKIASELIAKISKEELARDIGKAGLDTLSIILYEGPVSRADIDYIRGVSSHYIVRNLLIRGLVSKIENPKDERKIMYAPTIELLAHLGVSKVDDLPDYDKIRAEIALIKENNNNVVA